MQEKRKQKSEETREPKIVVKTIRDDDKAEVEVYKICSVCGHANKQTNGYCAMCSNYLF